MLNITEKISESVDLIDRSPEIEGAVLCSTVANVFTAGLDLEEFYQPKASDLHDYWVLVQQTTAKLYGMKKPLAVEIGNTAILAGCMLSLVGDHRIMRDSPDAVIGLNETLYDFACPPWLCQLFVDTIGRKQAEKALIEGQVFSPMDALKIGLVDVVSNDVKKASDQFFERLAAIPLDARMRTKYALREEMTGKIMETAARDGDRFVEHVLKPTTQAGVTYSLS